MPWSISYMRDAVSAVIATAAWLGDLLGVWVAVCHSRYCIKTNESILKLLRPYYSPIIELFGTHCLDLNFQSEALKTPPGVGTRSSADADNRLDAFSGQSRSTNMVPFHMLHIVYYCAIVTLSLWRAVFTLFVFEKLHDLEMGVKGHSRSLRVISFDRLCTVSYYCCVVTFSVKCTDFDVPYSN